MEASLYLPTKGVLMVSWMFTSAVFFDVSFTMTRLGVSAVDDHVTNRVDLCSDKAHCENPPCSCNSSDIESTKSLNLTTEPDSSSILWATSSVGFVPEGTSVDVSVCSSCLTDDRQGTITALGLVVCVVTGNNTCTDCGQDHHTTMMATNFSSTFSTWASAAMSNFQAEYRLTPDDWHSTLVNSSGTVVFTVGSDSNCSRSQLSIYCNGPLPPGMDITISVVKCTPAACTCLTFKGLFTTKARNAPAFNTPGFATGVALGSAVVLTAIIMTIVLCITDRQPRTDGDVNTFTETDLKDVVHHDVGISGASGVSDTGVPCFSVTEGVGRGCADGRVSSLEQHDNRTTRQQDYRTTGQHDNRTTEDENEIAVVSEEVTEIPPPESTKQGGQGRRGSRRMSLTTLM